MVTIAQFKQGVCRYIDNEFTNKVHGLRKWAIAGYSILMMDRLEEMLEDFSNDDGMIDVDRIYSVFKDVARKHGSVTDNFAMLGDVTFSEVDIDKLRNYILS